MSWETERQNIVSHFKTEFGLVSALPVKYENRDFDPPDDGVWVELYILRGRSAAAALVGSGGTRYRHIGLLQFDVVTEQGQGSRSALLVCDQIAAIFRGKKVSGIWFRSPDGPIRQYEPDTSRNRFIITIPYQRDETL